MSRPLASLAVVLACLTIGASPAAGQDGNGLYEPFPSGVSKERAKRFLERLPSEGRALVRDVSERDLERGVFVGSGSESAATGVASVRAGVPGDGSAMAWPAQLALLLVPLGAGAALASRRR